MARKEHLSEIRKGTVINGTSKAQEKDIQAASRQVREEIVDEFAEMVADFDFRRQITNTEIVAQLNKSYPDENFSCELESTCVKPDGGMFGIHDPKTGRFLPVLISEAKNQGTNDRRAAQGRMKQAQGNAVERLGKNVIAFRTLMMPENIMPFICFGYGCDFAEGSSIRDRIVSIAQYGELNTTYLHNTVGGRIARGSFYFREARWSVEEMVSIMRPIAHGAVTYYLDRYGSDYFGRA